MRRLQAKRKSAFENNQGRERERVKVFHCPKVERRAVTAENTPKPQSFNAFAAM